MPILVTTHEGLVEKLDSETVAVDDKHLFVYADEDQEGVLACFAEGYWCCFFFVSDDQELATVTEITPKDDE